MGKIAPNGNGHGHATETPDVSHIKNIDVTHEASDVNISGIVKFVVALTIFGIIIQVLMWGMFNFLSAQQQKKEPPPGPMAMTEQERLPPEPRLQAAKGFGVKLESGQWVSLENREPQAEYRALRRQWEGRLNCKSDDALNEGHTETDHAATPRDQPVVNTSSPCVPIDQAMQKVLEADLLRSRKREDSTNSTGYEEGLPSASSSGREAEKRQQ
ncbi:MAG: hypothetical protein ABR501_01240 [Pyrinomonadaceae bacterium]